MILFQSLGAMQGIKLSDGTVPDQGGLVYIE